MGADITPLVIGLLIFISSLFSLKLGLSVAIIEILLGVAAGNLGLTTEEWMIYFANFGGILLTFLAGAEIDTGLMKKKIKESLLIGFFSFLTPFITAFLYTYYYAGWSLTASLIAGTALSETSIAVVYSVLLETNLSKTMVGNMLMSSTFITNMGTAVMLSILFARPTLYTAIFIAVSIVVIFLATNFSHHVFDNPKLKNKLRTVAFAIITPIFFIVVGMKVSLPLIISALGLFAALFIVKQSAKFIGIYFLAKRYIPNGNIYATLLLSTGLTFGLIALIFGLRSGLINQVQYSVLTGVLIASAVIPTFIAQKWFMPVHSEDLVDINCEEK